MQEAPVLRPLSVGDIIDRVLRLIRANALLFIGIALIPDLIIEVLQRVAGLNQTFDLNELGTTLSSSGGTSVVPRQLRAVDPVVAATVAIVGIGISIVQAGALIDAIGQRYLGRPITVGEAYRRGLRAAPRLLLSGLAVIAAFVVVFVVFAVALAVFNSSALVAVAVVLGVLALLVVFPWAVLSLAVVGPALVLEGLGPIAAIRRSLHLMDKARLRALGLYILMGFIASLLGLVFTVIFLASFVAEPTVRSVLQTIANVATATISGPLIYGAIVLLYYDLRVRKEAFDLQLAAEALPREG
jgi:MFS family permease